MRMKALRELARAYGVQLSYEDATGRRREASRAALEAVLRKRIPDGMTLDEAAEAKRGKPLLEPVVVNWGRAVPQLPRGAAVELEDGGEWHRGMELPFGCHTVHFEGRTSLLIAAPRQACPLEGRTWGLFVPPYAAHSEKKGGGHLGVLREYLDWMNELGGGVLATLPTLAGFPDEPSPYSPLSRLYWNERYLDRSVLPERAATLEESAAAFVPDAEFERFAAGAWEYAWFRATLERREDPRTARPPRSLHETAGDDRVRFHLYAQYQMTRQMRALSDAARQAGPGLYLDFPLGVNASGYDVWRYPHVFARGVSVGAPPDAFFTKGQDWGFPPFDPDGLRADRYRYFRAAVRHHVQHAGILRLDHVMGLHRLYWIPEGAAADDGVYVRYRDDELYAVIALESHRARCAVVGEDLGTVPEYVPGAMSRRGLRSMYVVQYEVKPQEPALRDAPWASVASVNTHDMPTFAAFWSGRDIDDRLEQALLDEGGASAERATRAAVRQAIVRQLGLQSDEAGAVLRALLVQLGRSPAEVVLVNLEDLWGELVPQNVPGIPERSWKQRFRLSLEEARRDPRVTDALAAVSGARLAS